MLTLPIKKKWFDMILSGEKKEEYREPTDYWKSRFSNIVRKNKNNNDNLQCIIKNGYGKNAPSAKITFDLRITFMGREEWGATPRKIYYSLQIKKVERNEPLCLENADPVFDI